MDTVTLCTLNTNLPGELGLGRGSAASIVPCTVEPAGITTCPAASFTSWLTDPVKASPALACRVVIVSLAASGTRVPAAADRKSTRLNSSHGYISYAVFCLKKKKGKQ